LRQRIERACEERVAGAIEGRAEPQSFEQRMLPAEPHVDADLHPYMFDDGGDARIRTARGLIVDERVNQNICQDVCQPAVRERAFLGRVGDVEERALHVAGPVRVHEMGERGAATREVAHVRREAAVQERVGRGIGCDVEGRGG
jgi:hypothetical protein